jgi:hypothetical protein
MTKNNQITMKAWKFKLKNKRVTVMEHNNFYYLEFKTLHENLSPRAVHQVQKDKIVITGIKISEESAFALYECLRATLIEKQGSVKTNVDSSFEDSKNFGNETEDKFQGD